MAADAQEAAPPDTTRLQQALDACTQDGDAIVAVKLVASTSGHDFLSAPLTIPQGVSLVLDSNVTLYASRKPGDYQIAGATTCGSVAESGRGCRPFLTSSARNVGVQSIPSANGSLGRIDGRGGMQMWGSTESWWDIAEVARDGGFQNVPRLLQTDGADNVVISDIELRSAAGYHVYASHGDGFTAWGVRVRTPATARNTDGIDVDGTTNVTIANSFISAGDDGIGIKASTQRTAHVSVFGNHLYGTHGLSIGALTAGGVDDVVIRGNTITGVDAFGMASETSVGIRIKSATRFGGKVEQVHYKDTCIDQVQRPIDIDPFYFDMEGKTTPWFTGISIDGLAAVNSPPGAVTRLNGLDGDHPLVLTMSNVQVDAARVRSSNAEIAANGVTFGGEPLALDGPDVNIATARTAPSAPSCTFPPFPND
ncbi:glycoside hydrolase family 28 protein [Microbacterium sp. B19]|uniref:glycoside hydrolase family 28 protein n=1 Tax=Microbacterium sp. B19 TaxID=96765 RepID=UPI00034C9F56|nr:glycosyl hydrolase family 28 protein [Microbacterium sp. B19]